jgi:multiple sugar transport system ATP-binding protein
MHDGIIEQIGTPLELYDSPVNQFVAGFIGSPAMNFLKGSAKASGGLSIEIEGNRLPVAGNHQVTDGQPVVYGIRPEHLEIAADGFPAKVAVVEPTGSETMVVVRVGETEITALFRERHSFTPGQTVNLRPRADQVHLFDSTSGHRV